MADFTAIYSTKAIKNIHYSFKAESFAKALEFCKWKFSVEITNLICETPTRIQQFIKVDGKWFHRPFVSCSDEYIIVDINNVTLF